MIVLLEQGTGLALHRVRVRDRLQARIRAAALDTELAAGAAPEASMALALHAGHLCALSQRRLLARSLRRIAAAAEAPASRCAAPVCRPAIRAARTDLEALVERLVMPDPASVRGVARVRSLLADGTGPLYRESRAGQLRRELRAALAAMDPFA
jgi:uncharacterized heparinase superfamily protein